MGEPPAVEITITNMNDNVDENFLRNLLQKCGPIEEQTIYRHPRTQRRLGIARIVFIDVKSARHCIERYNQQSVMGNVMNVFHDSFGEKCKQLLLDASGDKKSQKSSVQQPHQQQQQPPPPPLPSQSQSQPPLHPHVPAIPPPPIVAQQMPPFKPKDEPIPSHSSESDPYYQMDYNNSYARGGHISSDHKPPSNESECYNSRDKYDEYGYDSTDHRQAIVFFYFHFSVECVNCFLCPFSGITVLMIKRIVGDGIGTQNHQDTIKIKIDAQIDIHLNQIVEVIVMMVEVTAVAGDAIMNTIEKIDVINIEAAIQPQNIVTIRNPIEIICHQ